MYNLTIVSFGSFREDFIFELNFKINSKESNSMTFSFFLISIFFQIQNSKIHS